MKKFDRTVKKLNKFTVHFNIKMDLENKINYNEFKNFI